MKISKKINNSWEAQLKSKAKFQTKYQPIFGYFFIILGLIILIIEIINKNISGGLFAFLILFIIGKLFLFASRKNKEFLVKTKAINKSQSELVKNWWEKFIEIFKR